MEKLNVFIFVESRYKVNRKRIKGSILDVLNSHEVTTAVEFSIAFVGDRKMRGLNKKFRDKDKTTNILSFPLNEGENAIVQGDVLRLGDIVISYPQVIRESAAENMLVDDRIDMLVKHGLMHLLGVHHDEQ